MTPKGALLNFWHAAVLGLVEGLTEFLPVSSTGHLILASRLLRLPPTDFLKTFEVAIQSGAMGAVLLLYGKRFLADRGVLLKTLAAFVPTAMIGLLLHGVVKKLLGDTEVVLISFFVGGVILLVFDAFHNESRSSVRSLAGISFRQAVWIGVCQSVALIPGVSRSAATILGGLAAGLDRPTIVEFSFLLAAPTLLAATALDLVKTSSSFSSGEWILLAAGTFVSFLVALAAIRFFLTFVRTHDFRAFALYRIAAAALGWFFLR